MASGSSPARNADADAARPHFISIPESLWSLRHRFPSVLRFVLLQCVRCSRWVAQPVRTDLPALSSTKDNGGMGDAEAKEMWTKSVMRAQRHGRAREVTDDSLDESHSRGDSHAPVRKGRTAYFIPNPETFVCQWTYCEMGDVWESLRAEWLGEIYSAFHVSDGGENGKSASGHVTHVPTNHKLLNEELAKELSLRRSERILHRSVASSAVDANQPESGNSKELFHVNNLLQHDNAILSCFCWVSCEKCGKMRQVEQPFPGGAPFVCALARNVRSCSVPASDILKTIAPRDSKRSSDIQSGDVILRDEMQSARSGRPVLPTLRNLTSMLRRKALGSFVKNILLSPEEIRAKRDDVVRSLIAADVGNAGESPVHASRKSPERKTAKDENPQKRSSGAQAKTNHDETSGEKRKPNSGGSLGSSAKAAAPPLANSAARKRKRPAGNETANSGNGSTKHSIGNRRRRRQSSSDDDETEVDVEASQEDSSDEEDEIEIIHWVCCDLCEKWRIVPKKVPATTKEWHCTMKEGTTCDDTDDEVRMERPSKKRRGNKTAL